MLDADTPLDPSEFKPLSPGGKGPRRFLSPRIQLLALAVGAFFLVLVMLESQDEGTDEPDTAQSIRTSPAQWFEGRDESVFQISRPPAPKKVAARSKPTRDLEAARRAPIIASGGRARVARGPLAPQVTSQDEGRLRSRTAGRGIATGAAGTGEMRAFLDNARRAELPKVRTPLGKLARHEVLPGTLIPAALIAGLDSQLPGYALAQVTEHVYDSVRGDVVLIPQGSRLLGRYDSLVEAGQSRLLVVWNRVIFPSGQSMPLAGMPALDGAGYAGLHDHVDYHYAESFTAALLLSAVSAGVQLSQGSFSGRDRESVREIMAASLGQELGRVATQVIENQLRRRPTIRVRPGYTFNVLVTDHLVFSAADLPTTNDGEDS